MPLHALPATPADVPTMVEIHFSAFSTGIMPALFRATPAVREWWASGMIHAMEHDPYALFLKAVDDATGQIVAFAHWVRPRPDPEVQIQFPPAFPDGANEALFKGVIRDFFAKRMELMGGAQHWYLELLATHPAHQRRGAASLLISTVLQDPANADIPAYVESSPAGSKMYPRHGFEKHGSIGMDIEGYGWYETLLMPRYVKKDGEVGEVKA